ncbi:MAG: ABC transporter ATP-binding protein [Planctomycetota bacterium]|nr:ABC transporter ATP-binding protein [Planctomycetota bacterium]
MLRIRNLHKAFSGRTAVDGLSIELHKGEVFGLLGPNGAGKSTTMSCAAGLLRPDQGDVTIDATAGPLPPTDPRARAQLGVAPQVLAIYDELTPEENLRFFARLQGLRGSTLRSRVATILDDVQLADRARSQVSTFSGGMKRRLNLGVALVHDPPLILLDEPTAGVDPHSRNAIFELIRALKARGRTILYTTHYMEEAQRLCDRVGIIDHGRLLALDTVENLTARFGGRSVLTVERSGVAQRTETDEPLQALTSAFAAGGVTGVRIERPDLESVFLALTGRSLRD